MKIIIDFKNGSELSGELKSKNDYTIELRSSKIENDFIARKFIKGEFDGIKCLTDLSDYYFIIVDAEKVSGIRILD